MFFFFCVRPWSQCEVWSESFGNLLALREESQHKQCGVCTRHRLLIRRLAGDRLLRRAQSAEFSKHLARQYNDRVVYWQCRARSRLPLLPSGLPTLCVIVDGMDHSKYRVPRAQVFDSKEFGNHIRPTLDLTTAIAHGKGIVCALGDVRTRKDSSWSAEVVLHTLHQFAAHQDLRNFEVVIEADNTPRECKNNTLTRLMAFLCGSHRCRRAQLQFLQSGHSHEDIDQFFSVLSNLVERTKILETAECFRTLIEKFLKDPEQRPEEQMFREVRRVSHVRAWPDTQSVDCTRCSVAEYEKTSSE